MVQRHFGIGSRSFEAISGVIFMDLKKFSVMNFSTFEDKTSKFSQDASTKPPVEKG